MQYRRIPRTELEVSVIGLGTMTWGEQNSQEEAFEQMDFALEQGVNLFDTAEMYPVPPCAETYSRTETIIGHWLADRRRREEIVLATKVAGPSVHAKHIRDGNSRLDRRNMEAALDASLRRLQTDYVDLYQLHWPDRSVPLFGTRDYSHPKASRDQSVPIEETLEALEAIRASGKVRYFGLSNETPWGAMRFLRLAEDKNWPRMATIQNAYNLLNRSFDTGLSEICHREDLRLLAYSPLAFGKLSGKYLGGQRPQKARITLWERFSRYQGPSADAAVAAYVEIAAEAGLDPAQMALAFINRRPYVASNLVGATTMEQLRANVASADIELPGEVRRRIDQVHGRYPNPCP